MPGRLKRDVSKFIALLVDGKSEAHPFEKHIALCMLCTWLYDPDDADVLTQASIVSAANFFCRCKDDRAQQIPLSKQQLASALADPPLATDFNSYFEGLQSSMHSITEIVSFFIFCPDHVSPSLNKAFYFIEQGGFMDKGQPPEDQRELLKLRRRKSTLKALWKQRAHTAAFIWAANFTLPELLELSPDDADILKTTERILRKPERLRRYFQTVRWCQTRLHDCLEPAVRRKITLHEFPDTLLSSRPNVGKFDAEQLRILSSYRHR